MRLSACGEVYGSERAINRESEAGHIKLREMHIHRVMSANAGHHTLIDNRKMKAHRDARVDATLCRTRVHECLSSL